MTEQQHLWMRLRQILSEEADDFGADAITVDSTLRGDLGMSGMQIVSMGFRVEPEFSIHLTDADTRQLDAPRATAGDVLAVVERHLKAGGSDGAR